MRVGTLCYATDQGLGILAKDFYDNGVVTDALVVRHGRHPTHEDWYPPGPQLTNLRSPHDRKVAQAFCASVDVMLFFETPFIWDLIPYCQQRGVKTVLMTMYECTHRVLPFTPDVFLCPSMLDLREFISHQAQVPDAGGLAPFVPFASVSNRTCYFTPVPVPDTIKWRKRTEAKVFVHNAGHGGLLGRNGTTELLEAIPLVKAKDVKFVIRGQPGGPVMQTKAHDPRVDIRVGTIPYDQLWDEGDVFVFPEKFNGLSLPLQEAYASGLIVACGERFPMTTWLPTWPMLPVSGYTKNQLGPPYRGFDQAIYDPAKIARKLDWIAEGIENCIEEYSEQARAWARANSWGVLRADYINVLANG